MLDNHKLTNMHLFLDGLLDAIVLDYDGGLSVIGLQNDYRHHAQVPRLYVRRQWAESVANGTKSKQESSSSSGGSIQDPFHSYFEYYYDNQQRDKQLIRGESGNILSQDSRHSSALAARRRLEEEQKTEKFEGEQAFPEENGEVKVLDGRGDDVDIPEEEVPYDEEELPDHLVAYGGETEAEGNNGLGSGDTVDDMAADKYHYDEHPMYDDGYRRYRGDDKDCCRSRFSPKRAQLGIRQNTMNTTMQSTT
jgi:hypothetical protein